MCRECVENRWNGIARPYTQEDIDKVSLSVKIKYTLAELGAEELWHLFHAESYLRALGIMNPGQAVQMKRADLKAGYVGGWQVAAGANDARKVLPDRSVYPVTSVPNLGRAINNAFHADDLIQRAEGKKQENPYLPLVADAEAGFGGVPSISNLMKDMIDAGIAAVHFEDQLGSEKKCGHLGGKVLVPTRQFIKTLITARLAADSMGVPTILIARTDAEDAKLLTSEIDDRDKPFILGKTMDGRELAYGDIIAGYWGNGGLRDSSWEPYRTEEGYYYVKHGIDHAIARALAYAPYADMLWMETQNGDLEEARKFAEAIHKKYPGKYLAYNCSPSFPWRKDFAEQIVKKIIYVQALMPEQPLIKVYELAMSEFVGLDMEIAEIKKLAEEMAQNFEDIAPTVEGIKAYGGRVIDCMLERFQRELGKMGYKFQFVTLAGYHSINHGMFDLAVNYRDRGMAAYVELQEKEYESEKDGYTATKHQREVGNGHFDLIQQIVSGGKSATTAMDGSTEGRFDKSKKEEVKPPEKFEV